MVGRLSKAVSAVHRLHGLKPRTVKSVLRTSKKLARGKGHRAAGAVDKHRPQRNSIVECMIQDHTHVVAAVVGIGKRIAKIQLGKLTGSLG